MNKSLTIILFMLCTVWTMISNDFLPLGYFYFYFLCIYLVADVILFKQFKFNHVWCTAFIYMIFSEVFTNPDLRLSPTSIQSLQLFIIANNLVLVGYRLTADIKLKAIRHQYKQDVTKAGLFILLLFLAVFCYFQFQFAIEAFTQGRLEAFESNDSGFGIAIINSMGFILPAVFAFYFAHLKKKGFVIPLLLSLPIFILFYMGGTRFFLLFSLLGFILVIRDKFSGTKSSFKGYMVVGVAFIALLFISNSMKENRNVNVQTVDKVNFEKADFPTWVSTNYFSPEGAIDMTNLLIKHFNVNEHLYGSSSSFILYFWVPRSIWKEKPVMIGNWLVRRYRDGFSKSHSVTFGFIGDLYADFGLFGLVPIFFIGVLMKRSENLKDKMMQTKSYGMVLGAMFYPVLFFFVRDPITSMMNFFGIVFFYFFIKRFVFREKLIPLNTYKDYQ